MSSFFLFDLCDAGGGYVIQAELKVHSLMMSKQRKQAEEMFSLRSLCEATQVTQSLNHPNREQTNQSREGSLFLRKGTKALLCEGRFIHNGSSVYEGSEGSSRE